MKSIGKVAAGREIYFLRTDQTVREASRYMTERRVGAVAVLEAVDWSASFPSASQGRVVARGSIRTDRAPRHDRDWSSAKWTTPTMKGAQDEASG